MKKVITLALFALAAPLFGQANKDVLVKHWKNSMELTIAVAEAMPAEHYGFRPNDEEMSFGQLMAHIATANRSNLALVAGEKLSPAPEKITAGAKNPSAIDKATAIQYLTDSFNYCIKTLDGLDSAKMNAMSGPEGRQLMGYERIWSYFTHTAHHRGQAEVYLRVKNIKPPTYKF